jgi:hypothetical protein
MYLGPLSSEAIDLSTGYPIRPDKITAEYVPAPPQPPGKIVVKAPYDERGYPVFPDLHLSVAQAIELDDVLCEALAAYEDRGSDA